MRIIILIFGTLMALPAAADPIHKHDMPGELSRDTSAQLKLRELRLKEAVERGELTPEQAKVLRRQLLRWPQQILQPRPFMDASVPDFPPRKPPKHHQRWRQQQDQLQNKALLPEDDEQ